MKRVTKTFVCDSCGKEGEMHGTQVTVEGVGRRAGHLCDPCAGRLLRSVKYLPPVRKRRGGGLAALPVLTGDPEHPQIVSETALSRPNGAGSVSSPTPKKQRAQRGEP